MTKTERQRINQVIQQANKLMDDKDNGISASDVVESLIGDLGLVLCSSEPVFLNGLVHQDEYGS